VSTRKLDYGLSYIRVPLATRRQVADGDPAAGVLRAAKRGRESVVADLVFEPTPDAVVVETTAGPAVAPTWMVAQRDDGLPPAIQEWIAKFPEPAREEIGIFLLASFNVQAKDVRKQERERVRETLLSEKALEAAAVAYERFEGLDKVLEAALDVLEDSGGVHITQADTRGGWDERQSGYSQKDYEVDRQRRKDSDE
jgi:hypothetical protein